MKKPWQIWSLYALCLLVVIPAMVWLTLQSLGLEKARENDRIQTELARREAELQERVSSALWRMDGFLTNLIAREATRPWYLYQSFYDVAAQEYPSQQSSAGPDQQSAPPRQTAFSNETSYRLASPLLFQPSEFVRLHFEIDRDNVVSSPQIPEGPDRSQARLHGLTEHALRFNSDLKEEVQLVCDYGSLLPSCSTDLLPETPFAQSFDAQVAQTDEGSDVEMQSDVASTIRNNQPFPETGYGNNLDPLRRPEQVALAPKVAPGIGEPEFSFFQKLQRSFLTPEINRLKRQMSEPSNPGGKGTAQQLRNMSRGDREYSQRQMNANDYAMTEWIGNNMIEPQMAADMAAPRMIREGVMQPFWIDNRLILARRVVKDNVQIIQGCWLDWEKIQFALTSLVEDLLPEVEFQPVEDPDKVRLGQVLATLPVQLVIDRPRMIERLELETSPDELTLDEDHPGIIQRSLWIAWIGLAFAAIASAFLLHGVLRLSERRGAFVSAVSHELRTPLTTFRMYAEMMAEKMVPPERQQQYAQTLKVEAERLWHLVENVLQFARLERSHQKSRLESVTVAEVLDRFADRLEGRAERAAMDLEMDIPDAIATQELETDPAAIEQILFNLVDNACKYAREAEDRRIILSTARSPSGSVMFAVRDFGPGVQKKDRQRMFQPFRKSDMEAANTAQGVGLGLALCRRMAKSLGGRLTVDDPDDGPGAKLVLEIPAR